MRFGYIRRLSFLKKIHTSVVDDVCLFACKISKKDRRQRIPEQAGTNNNNNKVPETLGVAATSVDFSVPKVTSVDFDVLRKDRRKKKTDVTWNMMYVFFDPQAAKRTDVTCIFGRRLSF